MLDGRAMLLDFERVAATSLGAFDQKPSTKAEQLPLRLIVFVEAQAIHLEHMKAAQVLSIHWPSS